MICGQSADCAAAAQGRFHRLAAPTLLDGHCRRTAAAWCWWQLPGVAACLSSLAISVWVVHCGVCSSSCADGQGEGAAPAHTTAGLLLLCQQLLQLRHYCGHGWALCRLLLPAGLDEGPHTRGHAPGAGGAVALGHLISIPDQGQQAWSSVAAAAAAHA
jgi:hypothetical protein